MKGDFDIKIVGKVNVWDVLRDNFVLGTPAGDIKMTVTDILVRDALIDAMKHRTDVHITIGVE